MVEMFELCGVGLYELWLRCGKYVVWSIMNCGEMWELCGVFHHELWLRCWSYVVWSIMICG